MRVRRARRFLSFRLPELSAFSYEVCVYRQSRKWGRMMVISNRTSPLVRRNTSRQSPSRLERLLWTESECVCPPVPLASHLPFN